MTTETYEILAIKYGEFTSRRRFESFIAADDHDGPHPIDYFVWLIRNANRSILVDCGFDEAEGAKRGRRIARTPAGAVEMLGVPAAKIEQLFINNLTGRCIDLDDSDFSPCGITDIESPQSSAIGTGHHLTEPQTRGEPIRDGTGGRFDYQETARHRACAVRLQAELPIDH